MKRATPQLQPLRPGDRPLHCPPQQIPVPILDPRAREVFELLFGLKYLPHHLEAQSERHQRQ